MHSEKCRFRHVEAEEKPIKKSKKGGAKVPVALFIDGVYTSGLRITRILSEKIYSTWRRQIEIKSHSQILQGHVARN